MCPGPGVCPESLNENPDAGPDSPPCAECPAQLLDDYLAAPGGKWISQVIDLDFALQAGLTITARDIGYPEFLMLRILAEERNKFQAEQIERQAKQHGS